jgi:hypothetical protein
MNEGPNVWLERISRMYHCPRYPLTAAGLQKLQ